MTGTTARIRWTDDDPAREYAAFTGSAGPSGWNWVPFGIYEETAGPVAGLRTHFLTSNLPGQERRRHFGHPDDLKAEAECWLEDFVSSLGASFGDWPDCSAVARFETIDHTRGLASVSPASTRAVVVYGARVEFSLQDDGRTLKVFLTDPAKADQDAAPAAAGEKE